MSNRWIDKAKRAWRRTARFRSGVEAGIETGTIVAGAVRHIGAAPLPPQPDVTQTPQTAISKELDDEANNRVKSFAKYELNRASENTRQMVNDLPKRRSTPSADRTRKAVKAAGGRGKGGRDKGGRSAGRGIR
ncbi:hypothetical protein [Ruania rhizosphaerae]|uniref:hypothetical protein n=1 Tax=Ruania rhizosphaerae TaxID=1840413 RepID=UPI00135CDE6B|nr:hypothetical protein [Ruania rhizosphaerae]